MSVLRDKELVHTHTTFCLITNVHSLITTQTQSESDDKSEDEEAAQMRQETHTLTSFIA